MDRSKVWAWGDTGKLSGLITHVLRAEYGTFSLAAKRAATTELRQHYVLTCLKQFPIQYAYLPFLAGLAGVVAVWRRSRAFALGLAGSLVFAAIVFPSLMNLPRTELHAEVTERFFLMPTVLFAPLVACGLHLLQQRVRPAAIVAVLTLIIPLNALLSFSHANWKGDTLVERYLVASISSLPRNAIVLGRSDTLAPGMGWVTRVMKVRPDVRYIDTNILGLRWYYDQVKAEIPDFPLPYVHALREIGEIAQASSTIAPTYLFPWVVPDAKKMVALEPNGLLFGVARSGAELSRRTSSRRAWIGISRCWEMQRSGQWMPGAARSTRPSPIPSLTFWMPTKPPDIRRKQRHYSPTSGRFCRRNRPTISTSRVTMRRSQQLTDLDFPASL
jgi:hypothetical protein